MKSNCTLALLGATLAVVAHAAAPPVKLNPAAADAVAQVFLGPEPDRSKHLAKSRQDLEAGALRAPHEERTANVLLTRGLTGAGVQALLASRGMELISLEAKIPLPGPPNHMMTVWLGTQVLPYGAGSLEELVDMAIGRERYRFMVNAQRMGKNPAMQDAAAENRSAALSPEFAAYRLEVVGTRDALFSLMHEPVVYSVLVNEDASVVAAFRQQKAELESSVIYRGPGVRMGTIDPNKPLPELPDFPSAGGDVAVAVSGDQPAKMPSSSKKDAPR